MKPHDPFPPILVDGLRLWLPCECCGELAPAVGDAELGVAVCRPCAIQLSHAGRVLRAAGMAGVGPEADTQPGKDGAL